MLPAEPGMPCFYCGVRPDVACRHRPATGSAPVQQPEPPQLPQRRKDGGQGLAFKTRKQNLNSRWGKSGNSTKREFNAMLPPEWRSK